MKKQVVKIKRRSLSKKDAQHACFGKSYEGIYWEPEHGWCELTQLYEKMQEATDRFDSALLKKAGYRDFSDAERGGGGGGGEK